jgi:hypothetical protein
MARDYNIRPSEKFLQAWIDEFLKQNNAKKWIDVNKHQRYRFIKDVIPRIRQFEKDTKGLVRRQELAKLLGVDNDYLKANANAAEASDVDIDILSNGFKCRTADAAVNAYPGKYSFAAFAEFPLVSSNSKPGTAR